MKTKAIYVSAALIALLCFDLAAADDDHRRKRYRNREKNKYSQDCLGAVDNQTYKDTCGACHFAYHPALLPSGSWLKILSQPDNHFGEQLGLEGKDKTALTSYLQNNGAESSGGEAGQKNNE